MGAAATGFGSANLMLTVNCVPGTVYLPSGVNESQMPFRILVLCANRVRLDLRARLRCDCTCCLTPR